MVINFGERKSTVKEIRGAIRGEAEIRFNFGMPFFFISAVARYELALTQL
jgi:hypothetical protein